MNRNGGLRRAVSVLAPLCFGYYVSQLLRIVNAVIAPDLARELHLRAGDLGLLTSTYFLAFALGQLPVGLALDRFGARRVVSGLMLVATAGTVMFAAGRSFVVLGVGRALAGLGVSACLMGALKVLDEGFAPARQTSLTGVVMAAGALGALSGTRPLEASLPLIGWRGALIVVAGLGAAAALAVALAVPRFASDERPARLLVRELGAVMRSAAFWRFAPQAALFTGGFMALQGLWVVPWLMTVEGLTRARAATLLLFMSGGMLAGQSTIGVVYARARVVTGRERLMVTGLALALVTEGLIVLRIAAGPALWFMFGFFAAAGAQVYGVTTSYFARAVSGRVSTALNLLAFSSAFALQWGIGVAVEALSSRTGAALAFRITLGALWLAQIAAVAWSWRRKTAVVAAERQRA